MINKITILGNLGNQPETKTLENGAIVTQFNVATSESWKDDSGEKKTETEWHRVVAWNKLAEIIQKYCKKGSKVCLLYTSPSPQDS